MNNAYITMQFELEEKLVDWIEGRVKYENLDDEKASISKYYDTSSKMWSSKFGENLVKFLLECQGFDVETQPIIDGFKLDLKTKNAYYEVKTRNYSTPGTIGEKILGTPYRYSNIRTNKPIYIVVVGFQEREACDKYMLFEPQGNRGRMIDMWTSMNIHFVRCSDLLYRARYSLCLNQLVNSK